VSKPLPHPITSPDTRGPHTLQRIGYGIIGAGWILPNHAIGARSLRDQGVELVAIADIDEQRARRAAEEFGARHWETDYRALLARDDVHVVSLCLPHHLHREVAIAAARAGKHVLCEKPLALDVAEADAMIAAARRAGVQLGVIFQHRWDPPFQRLRRAVERQAFGRVLLGHVFHRCRNLTAPEFRDAWREHGKTVGGGVIMMQTIHFLDILLWCLGPVESVTARVDALVLKRDVEDTGSAVLRFRSGAIGSVVTTEAIETDRISRIEVHGTTGSAVWENSAWVRWETARGHVEEPLPDDEPRLSEAERTRLLFGTGHVKQIADFVDRVRRGLPPSVTAEDGRHATAVVRAMYESSETGRTVTVR
jgi:UDP-N-acetyl-2-amino-2-deoxyglucuronate dehydrogenase